MSEDKKKGSLYGEYVKTFMPKAHFVKNGCKAFIIGGFICTVSMMAENMLIEAGADSDMAATCVTVALIMIAQLLTGIGVFDNIGRFAGAGVIVPITGFANSMVAPALEYKREGLVLGVGAKLFSLAGPVLVWGITSSAVVGIVYRIMYVMGWL